MTVYLIHGGTMTVYLIQECFPYEGCDVVSAWTTYEAADAEVTRLSKGIPYHNYRVEEFEVKGG